MVKYKTNNFLVLCYLNCKCQQTTNAIRQSIKRIRSNGKVAVKYLVCFFFMSNYLVALNFFYSKRQTRSDRYYQIFGREPEYPCSIFFLQIIVGGFKCILYYGLIYLILKWYVWPLFASSFTKYSLVQTTLNRSSSLLDRLKANRKLPFE